MNENNFKKGMEKIYGPLCKESLDYFLQCPQNGLALVILSRYYSKNNMDMSLEYLRKAVK